MTVKTRLVVDPRMVCLAAVNNPDGEMPLSATYHPAVDDDPACVGFEIEDGTRCLNTYIPSDIAEEWLEAALAMVREQRTKI